MDNNCVLSDFPKRFKRIGRRSFAAQTLLPTSYGQKLEELYLIPIDTMSTLSYYKFLNFSAKSWLFWNDKDTSVEISAELM